MHVLRFLSLLLLSANSATAQITSFTAASEVELSGPGSRYLIEIGDFNGDGFDDVVCARSANEASNSLSLRIVPGDGVGGFDGDNALELEGGAQLTALALVNLNDDNLMDLVTAEGFHAAFGNSYVCGFASGPVIPRFLATSGGGFSLEGCLTPRDSPSGISAEDFDGDGHVDLIVVNATNSCCGATSRDVLFFRGDGLGGFAASQVVLQQRGNDVAAGDLDQDGDIDLAILTSSSTRLVYNDGNGNFTAGQTISGPGYRVVMGDLNGDGAPEVLTLGAQLWIGINPNNGTGVFAFATPYAITLAGGIAIGDMNNDGLDDVVLCHEFPDLVSIHLSQSDASLIPDTVLTVIAKNGDPDPRAIAVGDWDGDGWLDIVTSNNNTAPDGNAEDGSLNVFRQIPPAILCQADLGYGGPGTSELSLCGDSLGTGQTADLLLNGAAPNSIGWLVVGATEGPTPFLGGTLVPVPALLLVPFKTDASGVLGVAGIAGGGGPVTAYLQALYLDADLTDGLGLSNALAVLFLP